MTRDSDDVRPRGPTGGLPDTVMNLFSDTAGLGEAAASPPSACASCGHDEAIQWLRLTTDWEDHMCREHGVPTPDGTSLVPLCSRCRAWAELIEIAEMAIPSLPEADARRIRAERDRFLASLRVDLVRGIRVSEELTSFSE